MKYIICNAKKENLCKNTSFPSCRHAIPHPMRGCFRYNNPNSGCIFSDYKKHKVEWITVGEAICVECNKEPSNDYLKRLGYE